MQVKVNAREREWTVNVPDALIGRAVHYAMGVIAQRETAGMADATEEERVSAIGARFQRIERGDWAESGGRSADPVASALGALLRLAKARKSATTAYKVEDVPAASKGVAGLVAFAEKHFGKERAAKAKAQAEKIAKAKAADAF